MKIKRITRQEAYKILLKLDKDEGILDMVTLEAGTDEELNNELNLRQGIYNYIIISDNERTNE